jgi:hypothetical protein
MIEQQHRIDREQRVVYVTIAGDVSVEALHTVRDTVLADPEYTADMNLCIEFRVLTTMPAPEEIRSIALRAVMHRANARLGRIAIVATTARSYEAAGLFELYADAPAERIAVFTDPTAARAWLTGATAS